MLRGYDVVAYVTLVPAAARLPQYRTDLEGVTYLFSSAEHRRFSVRDPAKLSAGVSRLRRHATSSMRLPEPADPTVWRLVDGRLFLFADGASKAAFELDLEQATSSWPTCTGRTKSLAATAPGRPARRVDRVPHYRSRDELARAVAAAQAKTS